MERKPVYTNDKKAPRMKKGEFSRSVITKELWQQFKKTDPMYKHMTWKEFYSTWEEIAETIRIETITNPLGVKLGSYTGELKLQYLPHKFLASDKDTSNDLGEKVNHVNLVTRGKVGKIKWERRWAVKRNKMLQFLAFTPVRQLNIMAKEQIDSNPEKLRIARNTLGGKSIWRQLKQ